MDESRRSDELEAVRDRMLQRIGGMRHVTRQLLLGQSWYKRWRVDVPPALYFESAETPATFVGLDSETQRERVRLLVQDLVEDVANHEQAIENALRGEPGSDAPSTN